MYATQNHIPSCLKGYTIKQQQKVSSPVPIIHFMHQLHYMYLHGPIPVGKKI